MTLHDPSPAAPRAGILSWLGLGPAVAPDGAAAGRSPDAIAAARQMLVADIGHFLAAHHLEVTSFTLTIAHDYLTGEDLRLVRLIDDQIQLPAPITVTWLEHALNPTGRDQDRQAMSALMVKLQANLDELGATASAAKTAATDYSSALEIHVGEIQRSDTSGGAIAELAHLATAMLERARELEKDMSRSDLQTRSLKRNLDQARRTADRDHLTDLPNRRAFEARLDSEYILARENLEPLCVAFCDIDNFKAINDTHGHEAGDRILKAVAQNLAHISNDRCHVARHGGEEFVVLFRGLAIGDCWELLDDTRAQQAERRLVNRATDVPFGRVTFSAGISDVCGFPDPRAALRAADQALYRAKKEGRNRIVIAHATTDAAS